MRSAARGCSRRCHRSAGLRSSLPGALYCPGRTTSARLTGREAGNPIFPRFHVMVPALMANHTYPKPPKFRKMTPDCEPPEQAAQAPEAKRGRPASSPPPTRGLVSGHNSRLAEKCRTSRLCNRARPYSLPKKVAGQAATEKRQPNKQRHLCHVGSLFGHS